MSLQDIRSECSEFATLLQPFIDRELADDEHERVSHHLSSCRACRSAVSEQMWVRATLRSLPMPTAPVALRRAILGQLDDVDAELVQATAATSMWRRASERARTFVRGGLQGGLVMVPAAAVALGLFVVTRGDTGTDASPPSLGTSLVSASAKRPVAERLAMRSRWSDHLATVALPPRVAGSDPRAQRVQLVGAHLDGDNDVEQGARLMFRVVQEGQVEGAQVVDRQRPAGGPPPRGTPVTFRGQRYLMGRADDGNPFLHFEHGGIAHWVGLDPVSPRTGTDDLAILLDVADHLSGARE